MNEIFNLTLSRRSLLLASVSGALVLGFRLPVIARSRENSIDQHGQMNAFISIGAEGLVTIYSPYIEMGQGTYTTLPAMVAEEMDFPMSRVRVEHAPPGPEYNLMSDGSRFTGDSRSIRSAFIPMRKAGAAARMMFISAAAQRWKLPINELSTSLGRVLHLPSGRSADYSELAGEASLLDPPDVISLKNSDEFRLLGTAVARTDVEIKTDGSAKFGIDMSPPGLLVAAIRQAPIFGGKVADYNEGAALAVHGVIAVENIGTAIVTVGETWWHAKKGLDATNVSFTPGEAPQFSTDQHELKVRASLDSRGAVAEVRGEALEAILGDKDGQIRADYIVPFLAHATMEPQNCTALVTNTSCTLWAPNQAIDRFVDVAKKITGLAENAITIHTPFLGGGLGRRFLTDFAEQALEIAVRHKGRPIKLIWSREEDIQHDYYRPMVAARYRARLGNNGLPMAMLVTIAGDGPYNRHFPSLVQQLGFDPSVLEGATSASYAIPNRRLEYVYVPTPPPIGPWRSVANSHNAFFKESFIDEMAHSAGEDPYAYRRQLLRNSPRMLKVLDTVAEMADWPSERAAGTGKVIAKGIAFHEAFESVVAQVAEVSIDNGRPRVHQVWCAIDCGFALDPRIVTMQMESGIALGLSAALHENITMEKGRTVQGNFHNYPILKAKDMPAVNVKIVNSQATIGGVGESATPPIAPAVCNAIFSLTGKRIRRLPIPRLAG